MTTTLWLAMAVVVGFVVTAPIRAAARAALADAQAARRALALTRTEYRTWAKTLRGSQRGRDEVRAAARRRRGVRSRRWAMLVRWIALQAVMLVLFGTALATISGTDLLARWSDGHYWSVQPPLVAAVNTPTLVMDLLVNSASQRARPALASAGTWAARTAVAVLAVRSGHLSSASALLLLTVLALPSVARAVELRWQRRALGRTEVVAAAGLVVDTVPLRYGSGSPRPPPEARRAPPPTFPVITARQLIIGESVGRGNTAEIFAVRRGAGTDPTAVVYKRFTEPIPAATYARQRDLLLRPFANHPGSALPAGLMWPQSVVVDKENVTGLLVPRVPPAFRLRNGLARRGDAAIRDPQDRFAGSYSDADRLAVGHDAAVALAALHTIGLVHTDLSWSNISCSRTGSLRAVLIDCDSVADSRETGPATRSTLGWTVAGDHDNLTVERARLCLLIWRLAIQDLGDDRPDDRPAAAWLSSPMRKALRASCVNPRESPTAQWWKSTLRAARKHFP